MVTENMVGHKLGESAATRTFKVRPRDRKVTTERHKPAMHATAILKHVHLSAPEGPVGRRPDPGTAPVARTSSCFVQQQEGGAAREEGAESAIANASTTTAPTSTSCA